MTKAKEAIRAVIDLGKTNIKIFTYKNSDILQSTTEHADWSDKDYQYFIESLCKILQPFLAYDKIDYIQVQLPLPFDIATQRFSKTKPHRPEFNSHKNLHADISAHSKEMVNLVNYLYFINDGEARARALFQQEPTPITLINHGTGISLTYIDSMSCHTIEVELLGNEFLSLRGLEILKNMKKIARTETIDDFNELFNKVKLLDEFKVYLLSQQKLWKKLLHKANSYFDISNFYIPEYLVSTGFISNDLLEEFSTKILNNQKNSSLNSTDLCLDNDVIRLENTLFPSNTLPAVKNAFSRIKIIYNSTSKSSTKMKFSQLRDYFAKDFSIDCRSFEDNENILLTALSLMQLNQHHIENVKSLKYPLPRFVRLNPYINNTKKFISEFAESLQILNSLYIEGDISIVVPVYDEKVRILPPDISNPYGENFLRIKAYQLEALFHHSPSFYRLIIVDDGSSDNTFNLLSSESIILNKILLKGCIKVVKLEQLLHDKFDNIKINSNLTNVKDSIKGGSSLAGLAIASRFSKYVVLSDADLEIHLGSLGVLVQPLILNHNVALTVAYRQKFLSNAGRGIKYIIQTLTDINKYKDTYLYLLKRFALCHAFFPDLIKFPDYQTGFKAVKSEIFEEFLLHNTNFKDSYDFDILEYALENGTVQNIPITPVFVSKEATKFPYDAKIKKFEYYKSLAKSRFGYKYYILNPLTSYFYIYSFFYYLLIPALFYPLKFIRTNSYYERFK